MSWILLLLLIGGLVVLIALALNEGIIDWPDLLDF